MLRVRAAELKDAPMLAELGASTFVETFQAENSADDIRAYILANFRPEVQAREMADPNVSFLVAEIGAEPVGYAKLQRGDAPACVTGPSPIEIARIYVKAEHHGRGAGAALMNACLDRARALGAKTIWLGVWERNERALDFYRRFGFGECGEHPFVLGSDRQRDLVMARSLD